MRNIARLLAAALLTLIAGPAFAQNLPANTVTGRLGIPVGGGPAQSIPFAQLKSVVFPALTVVSPIEFGAVPNVFTPAAAATNQIAFTQALAASNYIACKPGDAYFTQAITIPINTLLFQNCQLDAGGTYGSGTAVLSVTGNDGLVIDNVLVSINIPVYPTVNGIAVINSNNITLNRVAPSGAFAVYVVGASDNVRITNSRFLGSSYGRAIWATSNGGGSSTVTVTSASPGVFTKTAHGLSVGQTVILYTSGALYTPLSEGQLYFVAATPTPDTFTLALTRGGAAINTSGSQSGTHYFTANGPTNLTIDGNYLTKNYATATLGSTGFITTGVYKPLIVNNIVDGVRQWGAACTLGSNCTIANNTVNGSEAECVTSSSAFGAVIANNICMFDETHADTGISISSSDGPPNKSVSITGNVLDRPRNGAMLIGGGAQGSTVSGNTINSPNLSGGTINAGIALDGFATTGNFIGKNSFGGDLSHITHQVKEAAFTGGGTPSGNYITQQIGAPGTTGYILNVATTEAAVRAVDSPSSSDTMNGYQFGSSRFALRDLTSSSVDLFDYTSTLVASLGNGSTDPEFRVGQSSFAIYTRGFGSIMARIDNQGWGWANVAMGTNPVAGTSRVIVDSTTKALVSKDDAGIVHTTVIADAGATNNFLTGITAAGAITKAQPSAANLSNGTTGTVGSAVVLQTSPTLTTPVLGAASATTIAMNVNSSAVAGPSIGNGSNTLLLVGGTSGFQWNNQTNGAALFTMTNAGAVAFSTYGVGNHISDASGNITSVRGQLYGVSSNTAATAGNIGELITSTLATGSAVSLVTGTAKTITSVSLTAGEWDVSGTANYVTGATTTVQSLWCSISSTNNTLDATLGTYANQMYTTAGSVLSDTNDPAVVCPTVRKSLSTTTTIFLIALSGFGTSTNTAAGFIRATRVH